MQVHLGGVEYKMDTVPLQDIPFPVRLRRPKSDAAKENEISCLFTNPYVFVSVVFNIDEHSACRSHQANTGIDSCADKGKISFFTISMEIKREGEGFDIRARTKEQ